MIEKYEKVCRIAAIVLIAAIVFGFIAFNALLFITNKLYEPGSHSYITDPNALEKRIELRKITDKIYTVTMDVSKIGMRVMIFAFILTGKHMRFSRFFPVILGIPLAVILCTGLFSLIDTVPGYGGWEARAFYLDEFMGNYAVRAIRALVVNVIMFLFSKYIRKEPATVTEAE